MCAKILWFSGSSSDTDIKTIQTRLFYSKIEVLAAQILRSSSQTGSPIRNVYFSMAMDLICSWLYHRQDFRNWLSIMAGVLYETGTASASRAPVFTRFVIVLIFGVVLLCFFDCPFSVSCAECCTCLCAYNKLSIHHYPFGFLRLLFRPVN